MMETLIRLCSKRLSFNDNAMLLEEFTKEEVKEAIDQIHPLKAQERDESFRDYFITAHWKSVGHEVITTCLEVLNKNMDCGCLNDTLLCLIPKVKDPKKVEEFRPLSLCNVVYKVISKCLANRMAEHGKENHHSILASTAFVGKNKKEAFGLIKQQGLGKTPRLEDGPILPSGHEILIKSIIQAIRLVCSNFEGSLFPKLNFMEARLGSWCSNVWREDPFHPKNPVVPPNTLVNSLIDEYGKWKEEDIVEKMHRDDIWWVLGISRTYAGCWSQVETIGHLWYASDENCLERSEVLALVPLKILADVGPYGVPHIYGKQML
uniref:Reverse transcriptase n=1 Tax=Cannabis sativa TaxID=3483 RepID=A0A803NVV6_CANSA